MPAGLKGLGRTSATSTATGSSEKSGGGREGAQALRLARSGRPVARLPGVGVYMNELLIGAGCSSCAWPCSTALPPPALTPGRAVTAGLPCQACRPCWSGLWSCCPRCTRLSFFSQVGAARENNWGGGDCQQLVCGICSSIARSLAHSCSSPLSPAVRVVPVPAVLPSERLLLRRLRFPGFCEWQAVLAPSGCSQQAAGGIQRRVHCSCPPHLAHAPPCLAACPSSACRPCGGALRLFGAC